MGLRRYHHNSSERALPWAPTVVVPHAASDSRACTDEHCCLRRPASCAGTPREAPARYSCAHTRQATRKREHTHTHTRETVSMPSLLNTLITRHSDSGGITSNQRHVTAPLYSHTAVCTCPPSATKNKQTKKQAPSFRARPSSYGHKNMQVFWVQHSSIQHSIHLEIQGWVLARTR